MYMSPRKAFLRHIYSERSCRSSDSGLHIFDGSAVIQIWLVICLGDGVDLSHWSEITAHMAQFEIRVQMYPDVRGCALLNLIYYNTSSARQFTKCFRK